MIEAVKFGTWNIPRANRLDSNSVQLRTAIHSGFRMDGGISAFGSGRKPVEPRIHTVAFVIRKGCEADLITAKNTMMRALLVGEEQLWFDSIGRLGPSLYTVASLDNVDVSPMSDDWSVAAVKIDFDLTNPLLFRPLSAAYLTTNGFNPVTVPEAEFGESDLLFENRVFHSVAVSASPTDFTITNDTNSQSRTRRIIIRLEALGAAGWVNPKIENLTTNQFIQITSLASGATHVLQINCSIGAGGVRESTDSGASFVDTPVAGNKWPDTTLFDKQAPIMELIPGDNDIRITSSGTPNFNAMFLWRPAYLL